MVAVVHAEGFKSSVYAGISVVIGLVVWCIAQTSGLFLIIFLI